MRVRSNLLGGSLALALVVVAAPAFAAEGRIPVWAPLTITCPCPPGTGPGKYVLTRDVSAVAGGGAPAISVIGVAGALEEVEIDLNGFTVFGDPGGLTDVIFASNLRSLTIRNGSVRALGPAPPGDVIHVIDTQKVVIEDVKTLDGGTGINLERVLNFAVRRNVVVNPGGDGIRADGTLAPVVISGSIEDNLVRSANGRGIVIENKNSSTAVRNNRVERAGADGIRLFSGGSFVIAENTVEEAVANGITVDQGQSGKLFNNVVHLSGAAGILVVASNSLLVLDNVSSNNISDGMIITGSVNQIDRNTINFNGACGLHFPAASGNNTFGRNMARGNSAAGCVCAAIAAAVICPAPYGAAGALAAPDFCNESAVANTSFCDNLMPGPPRS